jgi:UPF0755 protein
MKPSMRRAFWVFLATTMVGLLAMVIFVYQIWTFPERSAGPTRGNVQVVIAKGATAQDVSALLENAGLIRNPLLFRLYAVQRGAASRIRPGTYDLRAPVTPKVLVDTFIKGVAEQLISVTLPPGKTFVEYADILDAAGVTRKTDFITQAVNPLFVKTLELPGNSLEGYLYPDTYKLRPRTPAAEVAAVLVRRHKQVWDELETIHAEGLQKLRQQLGFEAKHVIILASIVEKETGRVEERPRIAQLYLNRLIKPDFIPRILQADPTIIYGCTVAPLALGHASPACQRFKNNNIQTIHLRDKENEYNTYTHQGLPPGPIANPARGSMEAVLKPDGSPYLYFVATGSEGRHHFSTTQTEQDAAVVKYQRGGRPLPGRKP